MQQVTHAPPRTLHTGLPARLWLAVAVVMAGAAIAIVLALSSGNNTTVSPKPAASPAAPNVRYDGGPEEGTAGPSAASQPADTGARLDHRGLKFHASSPVPTPRPAASVYQGPH
jgi:hypothetical protein